MLEFGLGNQMGPKRTYRLLLITGLILLLLRAWQLRFPGLIGPIIEDEIHHNYWLLKNQSVLGEFTIWQLQPLLDFFLRLYFWFPLLRYGWWSLWSLSLLTGAVLLEIRTLRSPQAGKGSVRAYQWRLVRSFFIACAVSSLIAAIWLLVLLHPLSLLPFGISLKRLFLLTVPVLLMLLSGYGLYALKRNHSQDLILRGWLSQKAAIFSLPAIMAMFTGLAWASILLPKYGLVLIPVIFQEVYVSLVPLIALMVALGTLSILFWLGFFRPKGWKGFHVAALAITGLLALLLLKEFAFYTNYSELILRTPSLFYGLVEVGLVYGLTYSTLLRKGGPPWFSLAAALICGLWIVNHPQEIVMATYARHYSFVALVSIVWFWYFVTSEERNPLFFALLSFLFGNAHAFALPLIGSAYAFYSVQAFRDKDKPRAVQAILAGSVVLMAIIIVNFPVATYWISISASSPSLQMTGALQRIGEVLIKYPYYLDFPLPLNLVSTLPLLAHHTVSISITLTFLALGILAALHQKAPAQETGKLLYLGLLVVPVSIAFFAKGTTYFFSTRYYAAFLGFGFVELLVLLIAFGKLRFGGTLLSHWQSRPLLLICLALTILPFSLVQMANFGFGIIKDVQTFAVPPANSSDLYFAYKEIKQESHSMFILHDVPLAVQHDIPFFYLDYVDGGTPRSYQLYGTGLQPSAARLLLDQFISNHPNGMIVFDATYTGCRVEAAPDLQINAHIERVRSSKVCMWKITGAADYEEVCLIANALQFPENDSFCG